jgi:hypothetical protein
VLKSRLYFSTKRLSSIFDLSSIRDHEVDAKGFDSHTAIHHGREQEGSLFVDCVPVFSNEIEDFSSFVAVRRHALRDFLFVSIALKKNKKKLFFFGPSATQNANDSEYGLTPLSNPSFG